MKDDPELVQQRKKKKKVGCRSNFVCRTLMMNAQGPRLNSCTINITGNKLEFNLASWMTDKAIFKLQEDDFVKKESLL